MPSNFIKSSLIVELKKSICFVLFIIAFFLKSDLSFAYYTITDLTAGAKAAVANTPGGSTITFVTPSGGSVPTVGRAVSNVYNCGTARDAIQAACMDPGSSCQVIESALSDGGFVAVCTPAGVSYCRNDSDCSGLTATKCLDASGGSLPFLYNSASFLYLGICGSTAVTTEDNPFGLVICRLVGIITGKPGKAFFCIAIIVVGITFVAGKVSWNTVVVIFGGIGAVFGSQAIVGLVTGSKVICK